MTQNKFIRFLVALMLAVWAECLFTLEWSYPYCNNPQDGFAFAVYGFPFPYVMPSMASSLEVLFMPHLLTLNIVILSIVFYPIIRFIKKFIGLKPLIKKLLLTMLITSGMAIVVIKGMMFLSFGKPVFSIGDDHYLFYSQLRPVNPIYFDLLYSRKTCEPINHE